MDKPIKNKIEYYDLLQILHYIDSKVPNFENEIWNIMCDECYINNNTITLNPIDFHEFFDVKNEVIKEGLNVLFKEFPDIKNKEVNFKVYW